MIIAIVSICQKVVSKILLYPICLRTSFTIMSVPKQSYLDNFYHSGPWYHIRVLLTDKTLKQKKSSLPKLLNPSPYPILVQSRWFCQANVRYFRLFFVLENDDAFVQNYILMSLEVKVIYIKLRQKWQRYRNQKDRLFNLGLQKEEWENCKNRVSVLFSEFIKHCWLLMPWLLVVMNRFSLILKIYWYINAC